MAKQPPVVVVEEEGWIRKYWRPMMSWQYFVVCLCDFIVFPLIAFWYAKHGGGEWKWEPLTLKEGGFYHIAMGMIIGVAAYTRGQENLLRTKLFAQGKFSQTSDLGEDVCDVNDDMYIDENLSENPEPAVRRPKRW